MKIFLLEKNFNNDYDTFDAMIVVAENEKEALKIHPDDDIFYKDNKWMEILEGKEIELINNPWCSCDDLRRIKITYIGEAKKGLKKGTIFTRFNNG